MGQFFFINGSDLDQARDLYRRAISVFGRVAAISPAGEIADGGALGAKFPKVGGLSSGIVRHTGSRTWACGAGTWFYSGLTGAAALERLAADRGGFDELQADSLDGIDGSFAFVTGRCAEQAFSVITDRLGTLHVYSTQVSDCLAVSTSSLVLAALKRPEWDWTSCREFLATGTVFENRTLFRGIEKLEPAVAIRFEAGRRRSTRKYWDLKQYMYDRTGLKGDVAQMAEALDQATAAVTEAFPNAVFDLTGGFDSRAVLAAALRHGAPAATVVNGGADDPDVIAAAAIASEFGLRHRHQDRAGAGELWTRALRALPLCDGEYDLLEYAGILDAHTRLASSFQASVNGSNGEICRGYWWELLFPHTGARNHFDNRQLAARRFAVSTWGADLLESAGDLNLVDHFAGVISRTNRELQGYPNTAHMDNVYLTMRMQRWQGRIASATNRLWPCVSPFTFRRPLEVALAAPPALRVRNRMARRLIEYLNPRLAALPMAQGYPAVPLRAATAHLFWPALKELAPILRRRVLRAVPGLRALSPAHQNWLMGFSQSEQARDLLSPLGMVTSSLYSRHRLDAFLTSSRQPDFAGERQLGRVFTLELLARSLR